MNGSPVVIAVAAPPGAGKSTFLDGLQARLADACVIQYDDYERVTTRPPTEILQWMRDGADCDALDIPGLAEDLAALKSGRAVRNPVTREAARPARYILFEMPLGRLHGASAAYIDLLIWIEVPLDVALARNIREMTTAFLEDAGDADSRDRLAWLRDYTSNYLGFVHESLTLQRERVGKDADVVIDGMADPATMVARAADAIAGRGL